MPERTSLLLNLSVQEANAIREHAKIQRRPIGNYVLNVVMYSVEFQERMFAKMTSVSELPLGGQQTLVKPRTTIHIRCSSEDARRIREAAQRRQTTISGFVLHTLNTSWRLAKTMRAQATQEADELASQPASQPDEKT